MFFHESVRTEDGEKEMRVSKIGCLECIVMKFKPVQKTVITGMTVKMRSNDWDIVSDGLSVYWSQDAIIRWKQRRQWLEYVLYN